MTASGLHCALQTLSAYRSILSLPLTQALSALLAALADGRGKDAMEHYSQVFFLLRQGGFPGLGDWLWDTLRYQEAPYPLLVERGGSDSALEAAAAADVEILLQLASLDCERLIARMQELLPAELDHLAARLPRWESGAPFTFASLTEFYRKNGAGLFARYRAFLWEGGELTPVAQPDCFGGEELLGYRREREAVIANTRAMLEGKAVNNVLLYGEPGTGKSVTVKSLLNVPGFDDLRLIQVEKESFGDLHRLIRSLAGRRQKFILFIDDLAFDQDDRTYSVLKTVLEGGLEPRSANVAVYATSNRRHLVRQTFSDRAGDEVDRNETINEKTSLSERFGLRILFQTMSKPDFLDTVEQMARREGITMERDALWAAASRFEVTHPGWTPRTARQFIASLSV